MNADTTAVVIPVGPGRLDNVHQVLDHLEHMIELPYIVLLVFDGRAARPLTLVEFRDYDFVLAFKTIETKHQPGMEQPRNVGVRWLLENDPSMTHVWFLDSDILVDPGALAAYVSAWDAVDCDPIMMGPYDDLMGAGQPDSRADMFREWDRIAHVPTTGPGHGLGCFSGNLVWPIDRFVEVGGFHPMLHHGRCEDGELGLRAACARIPMMCVQAARGRHLPHERNFAWIEQANARDAVGPHSLINTWHNYMPDAEGDGDGTIPDPPPTFEYECTCGQTMTPAAAWDHLAAPITDSGHRLDATVAVS